MKKGIAKTIWIAFLLVLIIGIGVYLKFFRPKPEIAPEVEIPSKVEAPPKVEIAPEPKILYTYRVTPLINKDYFLTVHKALVNAKKSIHILMLLAEESKGPKDPTNILLQDLIDAHKRGVGVDVILDGSRFGGSTVYRDRNLAALNNLQSAGVNARFGSSSSKIHDKLIIIDDHIAIVGAHNWRYAALIFNNETSVLIESDPIDPGFMDYFNKIKESIEAEEK